ncbi:head maturation protease [Arthrobacter phage SWEP2]|uniref:Head maturation protease n=1 Tax=Arthrobacter phage SWEP2 TaxID=2945958 RepID=A0A9E7SGC9_9CAUD|nr:head maturation protease [Arthrobacter phage SWEP2]
MENGYALADSHRVSQVRLTAEIQRLLAEVWKRTIDPSRLDATFPVYLAAAEVVLGQGRAASDVLARRYYMKVASSAGFPAVAIDAPAVPMNREAVATSLRVTGPVLVKSQVANGLSLAQATQAGLAATIAAGKRIMLDGGREMLIEASRRDPNVQSWARVSDGDPCHFCAMLISRGPVYGEDTVSFRSHDRCGCGVRLVYRNERDGGWSDQATKLRRLWDGDDDPERDAGSTLTLAEWRAIYNDTRANPSTPVRTLRAA